MKHTMKLTLSLLMAVVVGCESTGKPGAELKGVGDMWVGAAIRSASLENAIISQATLFPYHFERGSAALNELGRRDLELLAAHYQENAGNLSVRRLGASEKLYEARMATVVAELVAAGVGDDQISISDSLAGGEGISSERVIEILFIPPALPVYSTTN